MINIKDLRIGNIIKDTVNSTLCTVLEVRENHVRCQYIRADTGETYVSIIHKEALSPIKVTSKIILACSAYQLPYSTVMNSFNLDLGRDRNLSIGCVGTPNLIVFLEEVERNENGDVIKKNDLICVHNWDYDGELYLHQLQNLYAVLKKEELVIDLNKLS